MPSNRVIALFALFLLIAAGGTGFAFTFRPESAAQPAQHLLGGTRDPHGCLPGAGYTWCEAKHTCLRVWERPCDAAPQKVSGHILSVQPDAGRGMVVTDIKTGEATTTEYILDPSSAVHIIDLGTHNISTRLASEFMSAYTSLQPSLADHSFTFTVEGKTITALEEN